MPKNLINFFNFFLLNRAVTNYNNCVPINTQINVYFLWLYVFFLQNISFIQTNNIVDLTAIDLKKTLNRFIVIYILQSFKFNVRYIVRISLREFQYCQSISNLFLGCV